MDKRRHMGKDKEGVIFPVAPNLSEMSDGYLEFINEIKEKIKKHFIENVDKNIKIAILYSSNQVFAVNQSKEKNLHNRYEGEFYDTCELQDLGF